jgi:oligopeptidase A
VVYHPDVQLYAISDRHGNPRGEFYLDNYARPNKRGGAWMDVCSTRQRVGSAIQQPIAYLTCNLTPPVGDDPALLTHSEVTTLFHEFGHGLHHMLTLVESAGVSGINGVEWDAVELPSQFMENWCWERESIDMISGHYKTGEPLPDELLEKMRSARNFQSAMQLVRQLEFSLVDMHLHLASRPGSPADVQATLDAIRQRVAVIPVPVFNRFQNSFSHIFAGGYSAGYFSYKWAEVLSADAFSRFEEEGIFSEAAGESFLHNVLEVGGSRDAMSSFKAFRGREPQVDAVLRHTGLAA